MTVSALVTRNDITATAEGQDKLSPILLRFLASTDMDCIPERRLISLWLHCKQCW
jgi:hypothetical protein